MSGSDNSGPDPNPRVDRVRPDSKYEAGVRSRCFQLRRRSVADRARSPALPPRQRAAAVVAGRRAPQNTAAAAGGDRGDRGVDDDEGQKNAAGSSGRRASRRRLRLDANRHRLTATNRRRLCNQLSPPRQSRFCS